MKQVFTIFLFMTMLYAAQMHTAKVVQCVDSAGYSYIEVQEGTQRYWIAMTMRPVQAGDEISFDEQGWMYQFHSKTLDRSFEKILFASDPVQVNQQQIKVKENIMKSAYQTQETISIAELFQNRSRYSGKKVKIRGKVTKTSEQIMKRNWVHLQDGSRFQNADDIVFTSNSSVPKVGDVIIAQGIVSVDKDFGYGYFYPAIVEESDFLLNPLK